MASKLHITWLIMAYPYGKRERESKWKRLKEFVVENVREEVSRLWSTVRAVVSGEFIGSKVVA
jgi:hypothetical protein